MKVAISAPDMQAKHKADVADDFASDEQADSWTSWEKEKGSFCGFQSPRAGLQYRQDTDRTGDEHTWAGMWSLAPGGDQYIALPCLSVIWVVRQDDLHRNPNSNDRDHLVGVSVGGDLS